MERSVQLLGVLHAVATRYCRDSEMGCLEQLPRCFDTEPLDEDCRRRPGFASEDARERTRAHAGPRRQRLDSEVLVEMVAEPRSACTNARNRSTPAVTPAEVHRSRSCT